jgi:hypothetical protein
MTAKNRIGTAKATHRSEPDNQEMADGSLKPGFIRDYVSGVILKETPEEAEAVQVFARRLGHIT